MKIERNEKPPIIIGARVTMGQVIMSLVNGGVILYNWKNPSNPIPGEMVGLMAQPLVFFSQVWWVNKYGVTS